MPFCTTVQQHILSNFSANRNMTAIFIRDTPMIFLKKSQHLIRQRVDGDRSWRGENAVLVPFRL